jgi:Circadian oscillating protein COP23
MPIGFSARNCWLNRGKPFENPILGPSSSPAGPSSVWQVPPDRGNLRLGLGVKGLKRAATPPLDPITHIHFLRFTAMSLRSFAARRLIQSATAAALVAAGMTAPAQAATGDVIVPTDSGAGTPSAGSTPIPSTGGVPLSAVRFSCQAQAGRYTVMYQPETQVGQAYPWAVPGNMGGGWSADRRCDEISSRLERYRPDGLVEMRTSVENGYNTVCVTTDKDPSCRIVFTVPRNQDPVATRDRVFENLALADSGQQTLGVNTYTNNQSGVNLSGVKPSTGSSPANPAWLNQLGQSLNINLPSGLGGQNGGWGNGVGGALGSTQGGGTIPSPANPAGSPIRSASNGINLKPFLDRADGGTGERLSGGIRTAAPVQAAPAPTASVKAAPVKVVPVKKATGLKFKSPLR